MVTRRGAVIGAGALGLGASLLLLAGGAGAVGAPPAYRGVLTFSTPGRGEVFSPAIVQELDLATNQLAVTFDGLDASRLPSGETAFVSRLAAGYFADHGVVVADDRGVAGAPVHVCSGFNFSAARTCAVPKLSPDGRLVAYVTVGSGQVCKNNFGMFWGLFVVVAKREGGEVARFEGFADPEWMPDGRLLMMGSQCQAGGVWIASASLDAPVRVDGGVVATPAGAPDVRPDGKQVAFIWNNQVWSLGLAGKPELTQVTRLSHSASSVAWSPDGRALAVLQFDVSMPVKSVVLLRPGEQTSVEVRQLPVYPYGPLSWR